MLINLLNTLEEVRVERLVVAKLRKLRLHTHRNLLHLVRSVCFEHIEEYAGNAVEHSSVLLQRNDSVGEGWLCRVVYDCINLGTADSDSGVERRLVVLHLNKVKRRCCVWGLPLCKQRVCCVDFRQLYGRHLLATATRHKCGNNHN